MSRRPAFRAVLLGALLGLHFFTRLHAQQVTPLHERHFYPASFFVALSLVEGTGFKYLLPSDTVVIEGKGATPVPPPDDPTAPVLGFIRLVGYETVSSRDLRNYVSSGTHLVDPDPIETTRILDLWLAAALWRLFGISWPVYFVFYAFLSTAAAFCVFFVARSSSGSHWCGLAAAAGFLASPLEEYAGVWSTRDTAPLWFAALAFCALAWYTGRTSRLKPLLGAFTVGFVSLIGLGWRADAQLVPPIILGGLVLVFITQKRPWRQIGTAIVGFLAGCAAVLLLLRALGPGQYSQGGTVFHTAWYGEAPRSNLLGTENAFQVARDDYLTLYQANYFARARFGAGADAEPSWKTQDLRHYSRCREMYLALARYSARAWWSAFPSFLARSLRIDHPTLLGSETEAAAFRARRPGWLEPVDRLCLDRYGHLLPWLVGLGLVGGFVQERTRWMTVILAAYFVYYGAATLLVLPEPKHMAPLLLPMHVLAAVGLWSLVKAAQSWRRMPLLARASRRRARALAFACAAVLAVWSLLGGAAQRLSRQERERLIDAVRLAARGSSTEVPVPRDSKVISVRPTPGSATPEGYLFRIRAARPSDILCLHVREATAMEASLTYYTRHSIAPGDERYFFLNLVSGEGVGEQRPYAAYVRLVGPADVVSIRRLNLSRWPLGLPLSLVFDEHDARPGASFLVGPGASTEQLPASQIGHLLAEPRAFLWSYRPN